MSAKKLGRPISRRQDLEPFTAHLTPEAKHRLMALAQITGEPAYRYVEQGFWLLWENLPERQRQSAKALVDLVEEAKTAET